jgi:hypothetical protein
VLAVMRAQATQQPQVGVWGHPVEGEPLAQVLMWAEVEAPLLRLVPRGGLQLVALRLVFPLVPHQWCHYFSFLRPVLRPALP